MRAGGRYLKTDMQHACWDGAHMAVAIVACILWLFYAVGFPAAMACVMRRHQTSSARERDVKKRDPAAAGEASPDYWTSTTPAAELFWYPLIAHLQVRLLPSASLLNFTAEVTIPTSEGDTILECV